MNTLTVSLVSVGGRIDQAASEEAFRSALVKHIAEVETETTVIEAAVDAFYDRFLGQSLPMPTVAGMVAGDLGTHENYLVLVQRVKSFLRANSQDPNNNKGNVETSKFVIAKGPSGGCARRSDIPVKSA